MKEHDLIRIGETEVLVRSVSRYVVKVCIKAPEDQPIKLEKNFNAESDDAPSR